MAPLEILYRGDVASVSVQYSYLPSWLSPLIEPDYGADTARAVFRVVYDYWRTLPKEQRPRLYLFGLSLGARNSDLSADFLDIIMDPYQGALWVGPTMGQRDLAQGDRIACSRKPGLATAFSQRVALPLYYATQRTQRGQHALGADANGLFAVPLRSDRFFRGRQLVASAFLDDATKSPGRGVGNPLDTGRHVRPADLRHDDRHNDPSRRRTCRSMHISYEMRLATVLGTGG
jgi:hypothetical protein